MFRGFKDVDRKSVMYTLDILFSVFWIQILEKPILTPLMCYSTFEQTMDLGQTMDCSPKDRKDPPMEGWTNLYDAGVFWSSKWRQFWGSNDP